MHLKKQVIKKKLTIVVIDNHRHNHRYCDCDNIFPFYKKRISRINLSMCFIHHKIELDKRKPLEVSSYQLNKKI